MADDKSRKGSPKKGSALGALVPVLVLTLAAGGGGALIGRQIVSATRASDGKAAPPAADKAGKPAGEDAPRRALKELPPVVTNLTAPEGAWIRLQTAVVCDKTDAAAVDALLPRVGEDILAFVRTLSLDDIQGASGLGALRDDLNERARLRSDGKVRELLIETLVVR